MALGGGTFTVQNKTLPGAYMNFVSAARADASVSERGIAAVPMVLSWGPEQSVVTVTAEDFYRDSLKLFGYGPYADEMLPLRELFRNARTAHVMRVNKGGAKAVSSLATALYTGETGNRLRVTVEEGTGGTFNVTTWLDGAAVDKQTGVTEAAELQNNGFVGFNRMLPLQAGDVFILENGSDGTAAPEDYAAFLQKIESYSFHTLGLPLNDENVKKQYADFTRRMREDAGVKFQCVLYRYTAADYEGVISVENKSETSGVPGGAAALVWWVTGAQAGCRPGRSLLNTVYNGELTVTCGYTSAELEQALKEGTFVLHRVGDSVRVLEDINTLKTFPDGKNSDFSDNQTVRLTDQIATDIAALFNEKYLGKIANDPSGRVALWSDIVAHHRQLELVGAIENFSPEDVTVEQGGKKSVTVRDCFTPTGAMAQMYMTVVVA